MEDVCSRCGEAREYRTRGESFCSPCFVTFLNIKFRKNMDRYRVNYLVPTIPKLLIGISFGPNSLALVSLVKSLLDHQKEKNGGRVGYSMECVYIGDDTPEWPFGDEVKLYRVSHERAYAKLAQINGAPLSETSLDGLSRTSRQDLDIQLRNRLLDDIAREVQADKLIYGFSMTRLSELVIAETVKGRGASLPATINPSSGYLYPLREILSTEIESYLEIKNLKEFIKPEKAAPGVTRLQSIDEIVHSYFASIQKEFPAVISTVSKTASKLAQDAEDCSICQNGQGICYACEVMLRGRDGQKTLERHRLDDVLNEYEL